MVRLRPTSVAALGLLVACWTPQHSEREWRERVLAFARLEPPENDAVGKSFACWIEPRDEALPIAGDSVAYAIDVETPERAYRRYLRITLAESGQSALREASVATSVAGGDDETWTRTAAVVPARLELFDESGTRIASSVAAAAPVTFLAHGFARRCAFFDMAREQLEPFRRAAAWTMAMEFFVLMSICELLKEDETLRDLALDLVDKSLVWSALWNLGITFSVEPDVERVERVEHETTTGRVCYRFPAELRVNGHPALHVAATVVEPIPPLGLTAGIVRIDGFRPNDDRHRFRAQLLVANDAP